MNLLMIMTRTCHSTPRPGEATDHDCDDDNDDDNCNKQPGGDDDNGDDENDDEDNDGNDDDNDGNDDDDDGNKQQTTCDSTPHPGEAIVPVKEAIGYHPPPQLLIIVPNPKFVVINSQDVQDDCSSLSPVKMMLSGKLLFSSSITMISISARELYKWSLVTAHYWLRPIESVQFRFDNFSPHFEGNVTFTF